MQKKPKQSKKSLGQVAYEATDLHELFPWDHAYHQQWHRVARAVVREYEKRNRPWSSSGLTEQDEQWERGKRCNPLRRKRG